MLLHLVLLTSLALGADPRQHPWWMSGVPDDSDYVAAALAHVRQSEGADDCGPAAVLTSLHYLDLLPLGDDEQDILSIRFAMTNPLDGTWPGHVLNALRHYGASGRVLGGIRGRDLQQAFHLGHPVLVMGATGPELLHWLVVIGQFTGESGAQGWIVSDPNRAEPILRSTSWLRNFYDAAAGDGIAIVVQERSL